MSIPAHMIEQARSVPIENVLAERGIKLRGKVDQVGPCPVCAGRDRFGVNIRKQLWNCRGCSKGGDVIALIQHLDSVDFREAVEQLTGERADEPRKQNGHPLEPKAKSEGATTPAAALCLWNEGIDPRGTLAERYLAGRALDLSEDIAGEVLRWHPGIRAMLAIFRDIHTDEPRAISRTFLGPDGRKIERKFLGPVGGCAIKLDRLAIVLNVGEGVETCLAARRLVLRPVWALGSAGSVAAFPVLVGVERLNLLQENDDASGRACEACAARWHAAGREVVLIQPKRGKDMNDAILLKRAST
jgi:hypothetical protein